MDNDNGKLVWVFIAADEALPTIVFDQKELAEEWVRKSDSPGVLATFPINKPVPPEARPLAPFMEEHPTLAEHGEHLLGAVFKCVRSGFHVPALILIYSTIDAMAWLDRDEKAEDVTRSDFVQWVETYLLPHSDLSCTAIDLYAARCAVVHSYSSESRLSRERKAKAISYAWGTAKEETLRAVIAQSSIRDKLEVVHITKLLEALKTGVMEFIKAKEGNSLVQSRVKKFYGLAPSSIYETSDSP